MKMKIKRFHIPQTGQALITLLIFVLITVSISSAAVILLVTSITASTKLQEGTVAYYAAESGIENALLRVLRDPTYTGESNLAVGTATVDIVVTPGNPNTILATGKAGTFVRKIQATATYVDGYFSVTSWEEIE